jgi:hypothetical protein
MASYEILVPHKKKKTFFVEFGGKLNGRLVDNICEYKTYAYWVFGIPGTDVQTGWHAAPPNKEYMRAWQKHVDAADSSAFDGDYRVLFGYEKASEIFVECEQKYFNG